MTHVTHHGQIPRSCNPKPAASAAVASRGIWRRLFDAVYESRRRHAERDIARFLKRSGWTDHRRRRVPDVAAPHDGRLDRAPVTAVQ